MGIRLFRSSRFTERVRLLRIRISRSPMQLYLTYGGTPGMTPKLALRHNGRWNYRIIFPKNSSFWSKANIKGQSKNGRKRLRHIVRCFAFFRTTWTMVSCSPRRKCISVRRTRCRR